MGRYEGQCGTCEHFFECRGNWDKPYDTNDSDKGYCDWYKTTYYPDDSCKHYFKRGDYRSDCYITTIVCEILGYDDDCFVLNSLRNLRDNYMQQKEECKKDLFDYDTIGPQIAKILCDDYKETKDNSVANALYMAYILPAAIEAKEDKPNNAITIYKQMTKMLKKTYNIKSKDELLKEYDQSMGGHGYIKTREA